MEQNGANDHLHLPQTSKNPFSSTRKIRSWYEHGICSFFHSESKHVWFKHLFQTYHLNFIKNQRSTQTLIPKLNDINTKSMPIVMGHQKLTTLWTPWQQKKHEMITLCMSLENRKLPNGARSTTSSQLLLGSNDDPESFLGCFWC